VQSWFQEEEKKKKVKFDGLDSKFRKNEVGCIYLIEFTMIFRKIKQSEVYLIVLK